MVFIKPLFMLLTIIVFSVSSSGQTPEPINFIERPYFFDAGATDQIIQNNYVPLTPNYNYSKAKGYGLIFDDKPESFLHKNWDASRNEATIDGLKSGEISFRADLPNGEWWLTLWVDGGLEDSVTTKLFINDEPRELELQAFLPHAEHGGMREELQKMYRIIQKSVVVKNNKLEFRLQGNRDKARLLSFSLIPNKILPQTDLQHKVFNELEEASEYNSPDSAKVLPRILDQLPDNKENEIFKAFWKQQTKILAEAEKYFYYRGWSWATKKTGLSLFDHLHQSVMLYDGLLDHEKAEISPLYDRALWYRGRLLYWLYLERHGSNEKAGSDRDLEKMLKRHPDDELVNMYNGKKIDSPDEFDVEKPKNAPKWAFAQWELRNRLKNIADWWTLVQQDENGEFGGKFGDDVEILRWWSPLILSGDSIAYRGWKKLADGVWNSSKIHKGYAKEPSDVEHSSEFISDTAPLMVLFNDDEKYIERLAYSAKYFRDLWTGYNDKGHRFFKSAWFSSSEVEMEPPKNRDVPYNARAVKAVRYYAWKSADNKTIETLEEWAKAWKWASISTQKGKPVGIIPASIEFPSGKVNGDEPDWVNANMYWDYFNWSGGAAILDQMLYTWSITGDDSYLDLIITHLELVKKYQHDLFKGKAAYKTGTEAWAAVNLGNSSSFWDVIEAWRLLTGNSSYDDLIFSHGTNFIKYKLSGDKKYLVEGMQPYLETVRYNLPMRTSEAIHTDRVFIKGTDEREAGILQAMVTGYGISESSSPYIGASWENTSRDLAILVTESDSSRLEIDLYSFSDEPVETTLRIWQLRKGNYDLILIASNSQTMERKINIRKRGDRIPLKIQPNTKTVLKIKPNSN